MRENEKRRMKGGREGEGEREREREREILKKSSRAILINSSP